MSDAAGPRRPDYRNRHKAASFLRAVVGYLEGRGLPVTALEGDRRTQLPLALGDASTPSDGLVRTDGGKVVGLEKWSLQIAADVSVDWSGDLREANRLKGDKQYAAVIGRRRSPALTGDSYAMVDLATLSEIIAATEGLPKR